MFLVFAFPVGSFLFLICFLIHNKICPNRIYAPHALVRRIAPIRFQTREKFAPGTLQFPVEAASEKVELSDIQEREKLRSVLQEILAEADENYQQTQVLETLIAAHTEEQESLYATVQKLDTEIATEEEYLQLALKSLRDLGGSDVAEDVEIIPAENVEVSNAGDSVLMQLTKRLQHAGAQLERILGNTEDNTSTMNALAEKYSVLLEDSTGLQILRDQSSQLDFETRLLERTAVIYHAEEELTTKDKPNKAGLRRIVDIFKNRKSRAGHKISSFSFGQNGLGSDLIS